LQPPHPLNYDFSEIVGGDIEGTAILLRYIRDKFDFEFLCNTILEERVAKNNNK